MTDLSTADSCILGDAKGGRVFAVWGCFYFGFSFCMEKTCEHSFLCSRGKESSVIKELTRAMVQWFQANVDSRALYVENFGRLRCVCVLLFCAMIAASCYGGSSKFTVGESTRYSM